MIFENPAELKDRISHLEPSTQRLLEDTIEAIKAFMEKRDPVFEGR